ncbi:DNA-directed DNA polymerase [Tanacetum coccineum]
MAEHSQKWHDGTSTRTKSTETSDGLAAIQAQLNNLGREIKKVNEKVYAAQVGCELCKGPHYTKDCPLKEEGKTLEEAYYTQFGVPFPQGGQYRAAAPGFYQRNNANPSYQERRQSMEESLSKNQGASIKALEIQIGQMSKVLQERGSGNLPRLTEANPRDHVKSISTIVETDTTSIRRLGKLAHTKLTVELANRTMKYPKGIAENVLVGIELRRNQVDDVEPAIKEGEVIDEPRIDRVESYENFFPLLSINMMTKRFYKLIMKDKAEFKGKNIVGAFMNVPIFVGKFSIMIDYKVVENMDSYCEEGMGDIIVERPFCKEACIKANRFDGMIAICKGNDSVTYQMA